MSADISGKTALITGGAKRLGRALAIALAKEGVNIVIHYRSSSSEANELAGMLRETGVSAWTIQADFDNSEEIETLADRAYEIAGRLDILINNASSFPQSKLETVTLEEIFDQVKVNAWAPFAISRQFANKVKEGHIVNFLDTKILGYDWQHFAYISAKHLLAFYTRMMAMHFAPKIAVNAVAPGLILPPEGKDESYLEALKDTVPMKRYGNSEGITDAVLFLLKSDFITGQVIYVDGGRHLLEVKSG